MKETYQFSEGRLTIQDPDLGIDIDASFKPLRVPKDFSEISHLVLKKDGQGGVLRAYFEIEGHFEGQYLLYYPGGGIETECFYLNGELHGPSRFYSENEVCLSETWFYQDKKEGKSTRYYLSGKLSIIERYKKGILHGKQEYYYENGNLKSEMTYSRGILEGSVELYWPNGQKKREVIFQTGLREGVDRMWNQQGVLLDEGKYRSGNPVGLHRRFFANGSLLEERHYHSPNRFDQKQWDESENLLLEGKYDPSLQYVERSWKEGEETAKVGKWDGNRIQWRSDGPN
ncbi:toxin-antitoxin system YwqK family antitoxin [Candidatus Neptunichlamydia sp. REUL1]|uniref:toxin-antitoxin system YwqK family antitoxin n=1 Tax=Candidatus Neptunichlamydia sp. REUL1 TaxID=3064277 RepID=UPI002931EC11|nr:toxin-antitoxin system YwqK family antitoxin [Candidatus Neptunochlamydia sp. REUL1]